MSQSPLYAGAARRVISPEIGAPLYGYVPDFHSVGKNDDLNVTAVALRQDGTTVVMLSADLGDVETSLNDLIRDKISEATGIGRDYITFSATHTHSGPCCANMEGWGGINWDYVNSTLIPGAVEAAVEAVGNLIEAKLGVETVQSDIGINRRQQLPGGQIILGQNPHGSVDRTMTVIALRGIGGEPIVNIVHYGCHGTCAGRCPIISRDWSGIMVDRLAEQSGCLSVYFNGAIGDIGPRLSNGQTVGDMTHVNELGCRAAGDAVRCFRKIKEYRTDVKLSVIVDDISLPYKPLPSLEEVNAGIEAVKARCNPDDLVNIERLEYNRLVMIKNAYEQGDTDRRALTLRQTLIAIGPVIFVPFPFEIFTDITLRLREYSPYRHTLSLSNTNGYYAYFPSQDQIPLGGYEIRTFTSSNTYCLTDDADTHIICENLRLIGGMEG